MRLFRNGSSLLIVLLIGLVGIFIVAPQVLNAISSAHRRAVGWYKEPRLVTYTLESLDSIEVKTTSLNISIMASDSASEVTVRYYANWDGHINDNRSSSLKIEENWTQNWLYVFLPKIDHIANRNEYISLEITVPKGTNLAKLRAATKSGKIEITGIRAADADLKATNQSIVVNHCDFAETAIANVSGSTTIKHSSLGDEGSLSHASGNMSLASCTLGNDFKIKGSCTLTSCDLGDDVKVENTNGNIRIDETVFGGLTVSSTSGTITVSNIIGMDLCHFDVSAMAGTIQVSGTKQGTIYRVKPDWWQSWLKITATSGNIVIN